MSDRDEIDDQAGFLAPMFEQMADIWGPQQIEWGPPPYIECSGCGKPFKQFRGQFGWQYVSIIVLNTADVKLTSDESGYPLIAPTYPKRDPVRYCSYACADKANPKPTTT